MCDKATSALGVGDRRGCRTCEQRVDGHAGAKTQAFASYPKVTAKNFPLIRLLFHEGPSRRHNDRNDNPVRSQGISNGEQCMASGERLQSKVPGHTGGIGQWFVSGKDGSCFPM